MVTLKSMFLVVPVSLHCYSEAMNMYIHKLLNILLPLLTLAALLLLQLPFYAFKFVSYVRRSTSTENVAGKVVLITGGASGIGKQLAYEYARKGSFLVLVGRRSEGLVPVAQHSLLLGSPDVITIEADVSKIQDCQRFVDQAINHFGRLDHLVNNAGIHKLGLLGTGNVSESTSVMDVNFWGSVYGTHFAIPHLKKNKGKVIVISSVAGSYPIPRQGFYSASKAALISFCETLRSEMGSEIGVTIVTPGFIATKMIQGSAERDMIDFIPVQTAEECAKAIVMGACRGDRYVTEPSWMKVVYMLRVLCPPELLDGCNHLFFVTRLQNKSVARMKKLQEDAKPHLVTNV